MRSARSKGKKDLEYLMWLHLLSCVACTRGRIVRHQFFNFTIEAHHAGARGMSQKADDRTAVPLCKRHHDRGSRESVHALGRGFWAAHGLDKDSLIRELNKAYDSLKEKTA